MTNIGDQIIHDRALRFGFLGAVVNSALYLGMVFILAIILNNRYAAETATAAAGVSYLCYLAQILIPAQRNVVIGVFALSVALGVVAGVLLLLR